MEPERCCTRDEASAFPGSRWVRWLAVGAIAFALGGCAMGSAPTDTGSTEPIAPTSAALIQITDREYVDCVREVLGITLTGADTSIGGITSASASEARYDDMMAMSYQTSARKVATRANLGALLGSDAPSTAQLQTFLNDKVSRLWRRPLTSGEVWRLTALYDSGATGGDAPSAFGMVLEAVLQAPSFLFHG
jgi:hypothetical protein